MSPILLLLAHGLCLPQVRWATWFYDHSEEVVVHDVVHEDKPHGDPYEAELGAEPSLE